MKLKTFIITETRPAIQIYTYEVEALSEDEAIELVSNGEVEHYDYDIQQENPFQCSEYSVTEKETYY